MIENDVLDQLQRDASAFRAWCVDSALPFWASTGFDARRGGFFEKLRPDGTPIYDAVRRLRVQARQIYVYAHAAHAGWFPEGKSIALRGFEYLMEKGHAPDGGPGFVHLLTADGGIENSLRDTYDHMFVVLACAWLSRATGDSQIRSVAESTLSFIDERLTHADGSLRESWPDALPRRQNPSMHAFELMLALHETIRWPDSVQRAQAIYNRLNSTFIDARSGRLREYFNADWSPAPGAAGQVSEPGHMAEWAWLLRRFEHASGTDVGNLPDDFLALAHDSISSSTGLLADETSLEGFVTRSTCRMWPQTESLKGWLAQLEHGVDGAGDAVLAAYQRLRRFYLEGMPPGCWRDQLGEDGTTVSDHVPASTFYHIFVAAHEMDRVVRRATTQAVQ